MKCWLMLLVAGLSLNAHGGELNFLCEQDRSYSLLSFPTVFETTAAVEQARVTLSIPNLTFTADEFEDFDKKTRDRLVSDAQWDLVYQETVFDFVNGNVASFRDGLNKLESLQYASGKNWFRSLAMLKLFQMATEARIDGLPVDRFEAALSHWLKAHSLDRRTRKRAPDPGFVVAVKTSIAFLRSDIDSLRNLDEEAHNVDALVTGYYLSTLAEVSSEPADVLSARKFLTERLNDLLHDSCHRMRAGRMALYLARFIKPIATVDVDALNDGVEYLRLARERLDLLSVPVLWAESYRLSSDYFELARAFDDRDFIQERLIALRDRSYDLSIPYR